MRPHAYALDLAVVLVFAVVGRAGHELGGGLAGVLQTAWPFLIGLAVGWLAVLRQPARRHHWLLDGSVVAICTLVVGMLLRQASGEGTATAFVLVAAGTLVLGLIGWRAVETLLTRGSGRAVQR